MNERTLQKICFILAIFGIFFLLILQENTKPKDLEISQISNDYLNKEIRVQGEVKKITNKNGLFIIDLYSKNSDIKVIFYKEVLKEINKGDIIQVTGILKEYKNTLEIQAQTLTTK